MPNSDSSVGDGDNHHIPGTGGSDYAEGTTRDNKLSTFSDFVKQFIVSRGEEGIPGSIKFGKLATAFVGGIFLAFFTVPIKILQTAQTEVLGAIDAFGGWLTLTVERFFGGAPETIAASVQPVESFLRQMGLLGLPISVSIGLLLAWLFWKVIS